MAYLTPTDVLKSLIDLADQGEAARNAIAPRPDGPSLLITAASYGANRFVQHFNSLVGNTPAIVPKNVLNNPAESYVLLEQVAHAGIVPVEPGSIAQKLVARLAENTSVSNAVNQAGYYNLIKDMSREGYPPLGLSAEQQETVDNILAQVTAHDLSDKAAWDKKQREGIAANISGLDLTSGIDRNPAGPAPASPLQCP